MRQLTACYKRYCLKVRSLMFSQYFGHYLLNKTIVTTEQLQKALELQKSTHLKLGVLAINEGFMSATQVEETHQKQMQMDKRFGEIALQLGYLTEPQLSQLLAAQKESHLVLGQVLVDENILTLEQLSEALSSYKRDHSLSDEQFQAITKGDVELLLNQMLHLEASSDKPLLLDYITLFAKNIIRFVDEQLHMETLPTTNVLSGDRIVYQKIHGDIELFTAIIAEETVFLDIASKYSQEALSSIDELAEASVSEFLNLHNGLVTVNLSNQGTELDMEPQQVVANGTIQSFQDASIVKVTISSGSFTLFISKKPPVIS